MATGLRYYGRLKPCWYLSLVEQGRRAHMKNWERVWPCLVSSACCRIGYFIAGSSWFVEKTRCILLRILSFLPDYWSQLLRERCCILTAIKSINPLYLREISSGCFTILCCRYCF